MKEVKAYKWLRDNDPRSICGMFHDHSSRNCLRGHVEGALCCRLRQEVVLTDGAIYLKILKSVPLFISGPPTKSDKVMFVGIDP